MRDYTGLVVHHSASPRTTTLEQIRAWHVGRGFDDIGYHFVIEASGMMRQGRPFEREGAHARGFNQYTGVCLTGDNTQPSQAWDQSQVEELRRLVKHLRYLFPGLRVMGHRDLPGAKTLCPGIDLGELFL